MFRTALGLLILLGPALVSAGCENSPGSAEKPGTDPMKITSTAFDQGQPIPRRHTGEGVDVNPPLSWSGAPEGAKNFALICDDPDAPTPEPWVHWVIYNLPGDSTGLPEGVPKQKVVTSPISATQGVNSWPGSNVGYRGPMPPPGHGAHRYGFRLYALDKALDLKPGLTKDDLLKKIKDHTLAEAQLTGTYERK